MIIFYPISTKFCLYVLKGFLNTSSIFDLNISSIHARLDLGPGHCPGFYSFLFPTQLQLYMQIQKMSYPNQNHAFLWNEKKNKKKITETKNRFKSFRQFSECSWWIR